MAGIAQAGRLRHRRALRRPRGRRLTLRADPTIRGRVAKWRQQHRDGGAPRRWRPSTRGDSNTSSGRNASSGADGSGPTRLAVPAYSRPRDGRPVTGEVAERGSVPPAGGGGGNYYPSYPCTTRTTPGASGAPATASASGTSTTTRSLAVAPDSAIPATSVAMSAGAVGAAVLGQPVYRDNGSLRLKSIRSRHRSSSTVFVGTVDSFDGAFQKLGIEGGNHKIELKAEGYEPLQFDVLVTPGETVTYKGEMKRIQ